MTQALTAPEIKSADPTAAFEEFARAFEAFKEGNDARLAEIDRRLCADVVTEEKVARIGATLDATKARLDRLALDGRRPALGDTPEGGRDPAAAEHKAAFLSYVRTGEAAGLKVLEGKALSAGSGRTVAISCPTRWSVRCCGASRRSRRSAPSPPCG